MPPFIDKQIGRANRNLLISSLVILGLVVGSCGLTWRYYANYFAGPFSADPQQLIKPRSAGELARYFITLQGDKVVPTGYAHITKQVSKYTRREVSRKTDAVYLAMLVSGRILLVKADEETAQTKLTGYLTDFDDSVDRQVLAQLRRRVPRRADDVLPMMLDTTGFRTRGTIGLCAIVLFGLIGGLNLRSFVVRRRDRTRHPIWRRLAKLGDPAELAARLDAEIGAAHDLGGGVKLTRSFLINPSAFAMTIFLLEHLVWAYKKVTKHKKAFITVNKTYDVVLYDRGREHLEVQMKEAAVDRFLKALEDSAPWVIIGWSAELEALWQKRPAELIAAVDGRRSSPPAPTPAEPPSAPAATSGPELEARPG